MIVAVLVIASAMAANTVSADSSGFSASFDETVSLPGSAAERYQGNYLGSVSWVENQSYNVYYNAFTLYRSDMTYNNDAYVFDPFTNIEIYRNGSFLFRVPSTSFTPDPAFIPTGWHRKGGTSTSYTFSILSSGTVRAKGNLGFRLCAGGHCAAGLHLSGQWNLW